MNAKNKWLLALLLPLALVFSMTPAVVSVQAKVGEEKGFGLPKSQKGAVEKRYAEGLDRPYDMDEKLYCQCRI